MSVDKLDTNSLRALLERADQPPWYSDGCGIVTGPGWFFDAKSEEAAALLVSAVNALPSLLTAAEECERLRDYADQEKAHLRKMVADATESEQRLRVECERLREALLAIVARVDADGHAASPDSTARVVTEIARAAISGKAGAA